MGHQHTEAATLRELKRDDVIVWNDRLAHVLWNHVQMRHNGADVHVWVKDIRDNFFWINSHAFDAREHHIVDRVLEYPMPFPPFHTELFHTLRQFIQGSRLPHLATLLTCEWRNEDKKILINLSSIKLSDGWHSRLSIWHEHTHVLETDGEKLFDESHNNPHTWTDQGHSFRMGLQGTISTALGNKPAIVSEIITFMREIMDSNGFSPEVVY